MGMVEHARRELEIIGEEPEVIEQYLKVIQTFADMGHSGGSAMHAIRVVNILLHNRNLSPITDWVDDWQFHEKDMWDGKNGIWQSKRNSEAFSTDMGKTYYLVTAKNLTFQSARDERWTANG
jgi:hypothetical protein